MMPSQRAVDLIKKFEGCKLTAYPDVGGIWTIGYGHTADVKQDDTCTQDQAESWLLQNLQEACDCILGGLDSMLSQNELDAICCFAYNVGCANFHHSTMRLYLSRGQYQLASAEFPKWDHVNGKVVNGLLARRMAEQALFLDSGNGT